MTDDSSSSTTPGQPAGGGAPPPPPADVRISAPSTLDAVADILSRETDAEAAAAALIVLTNERFTAGDLPGAEAAIAAAVQVVETRFGPEGTPVGRPLTVRARLKLEQGDYAGALRG